MLAGQTSIPPGQAGSLSNQNDSKSTDTNGSEHTPEIDSSLFEATENIDLDTLAVKNLDKILPFLAKLLFNPSFLKKQQLLKIVYPNTQMNFLNQLMLIKQIEIGDTTKPPDTIHFESGSATQKLKIVATEYIRIQDYARQASFNHNPTTKLTSSELFDNPIYVDTISYCLYNLLIKTTTIPVMNLIDMAEALLHLKFGLTYITRLVANMPDRCSELCHSLISFGERQDETSNFNEISEQRAKLVRTLCLMNPSIALAIRAATLQHCKMPSLTIMITLDSLESSMKRFKSIMAQEVASNSDDFCDQMEIDDAKEYSACYKQLENTYDNTIAFITGILLGVDETTSSWFAQYTKTAQQKRIDQSHFSVVSKFRSQILQYMSEIFPLLINDDHTIDHRSENITSSALEEANPKDINRKLIRANATLRLYCALRGVGCLKLNSEECDILLRLITCRPKVNQTSINFATTGVCTLLACSALINSQKEERRAAEWLKWLIKESNYSDTEYASHGKCSISELLLLIAIHFQNNQTNQIADLICTTLGMKLQMKASVSKCKSLFVQEVLTDQMITEHAVRVPVTKNLDNNITEFLPIHCVHQLLESRSFSKHQVAINDWIYSQICNSKRPMHHMLPKLIESYVNSVIISTSIHGHCGTNDPISEEDIAIVFKTQLYSLQKDNDTPMIDKKKKLKKGESSSQKRNNQCETNRIPDIVDMQTSQILLLYYLLLYDEIRLRKNPELTQAERTKLIRYSPDFMMEIPIFYLLQVVRENQDAYGCILPDLLKLVTSQYPQLCSIQHWLTLDHYEPCRLKSSDMAKSNENLLTRIVIVNSTKPFRAGKDSLANQLEEGFKKLRSDPSILIRALHSIWCLAREEIWPFVDLFIHNLHSVISLEINGIPEYDKLIKITTKLWWRLNTIFPRKLWVLTVNAMRRPQTRRSSLDDLKSLEHSWDQLALDPLIVLRCDPIVFRRPDFLSILLHMLTAFLSASKRTLLDQIHEQPSRQKDFRNLEELRTTLVLAQTSAAIQILLESCIPSQKEYEIIARIESQHEPDDDEKLFMDHFEACVDCICEHLHQVFIGDPNLAKLVHFQTYPSLLLRTTSEKIPSMHICLDFIPELLGQPDISKQVFVIELTSHLCEKYAITKSLDVAKLCFNVAYTLLQLLPSERRALFYIPVLPALIRICKVFPILREDAAIILSQINQITLAHMASTSSRLSLGTARPFEGLEDTSWVETRELMDNLELHEALYLCIEKCSLELRVQDKKPGVWVQ